MFPLGVWHYILGGIFVGFGISFIFLMIGKYGGASSFFPAAISLFSKHPFFCQDKFVQPRKRRMLFTLGIICGALLYTLRFGEFFVTNVSAVSLIVGGFFVGFGARYAKGCTSGHGVCGLAAFSLRSFIAVLLFLVVAIIVGNVVGVFL